MAKMLTRSAVMKQALVLCDCIYNGSYTQKNSILKFQDEEEVTFSNRPANGKNANGTTNEAARYG